MTPQWRQIKRSPGAGRLVPDLLLRELTSRGLGTAANAYRWQPVPNELQVKDYKELKTVPGGTFFEAFFDRQEKEGKGKKMGLKAHLDLLCRNGSRNTGSRHLIYL
jgi:hypothetical protein